MKRWRTRAGLPLFALLMGGACQRSPGFRSDQNFPRDESPSYYNKNGESPQRPLTEKVSSMGQPKKRMVVLSFWNDSLLKSGDLGSAVADDLRRVLYTTGRVILPTDLKVDAKTEDFLQSDKVRVAQLVREGRRLGVAVMVIGRISRVVFRQKGDEVGLFRQKQSIAAVDLEAKVFDVQSGRELAAFGRAGEASANAMVTGEGEAVENTEYRLELVRMALRNAAQPLAGDVLKSIEKLAWEGRIAKISAGKVYVNAGRASGLVPGDILRVMSQGEDIYDPASGAFLGRTPGQLKGTLEVSDFIGTDGAVAEMHTGANFQEGDLLRLY